MADTKNLYDNNKRLMGPVETSDEMYYLLQKLKFHWSTNYGANWSKRQNRNRQEAEQLL